MKATLEKLGWEGWFLGGDAYAKFLKEDVARWGKVIQAAGISVD